MNELNRAKNLLTQLLTLTAYRNMLQLPVIRQLMDTLRCAINEDGEGAVAAYCQAYFVLHEQGYFSLADYIQQHLQYDTSPYAELAARGQAEDSLLQAARRDVQQLKCLAGCGRDFWLALLTRSVSPDWAQTLDTLPFWTEGRAQLDFDALTQFYRINGAGLFSKYKAFLWQNGKLQPVEQPDFIPPEKLVGYRLQREQVYANTAALLQGKKVNNVLLYGESGTGKSATVKSMLGIPEFESLRLIEMDKTQLTGIPELVRMLGHRPQKFVLYIDDLTFEKDDKTYSQLKTILEGGLEQSPDNVAIYATSNRRHLMRETFSDRMGDEVDTAETIEEMTSLSERFGLRIPFSSLNQDSYLTLCYELAEQAGVTMSRQELRPLAIRFNLRHPGRTPRVAQQFIQSLYT